MYATHVKAATQIQGETVVTTAQTQTALRQGTTPILVLHSDSSVLKVAGETYTLFWSKSTLASYGSVGYYHGS